MAQWVKNLPAMQETQGTWVQLFDQDDPWRKKWQPIPVFLHGKFHGQRSLAGYSPKGCKESDMTERLSTYIYTHTHTHIYCVYIFFFQKPFHYRLL